MAKPKENLFDFCRSLPHATEDIKWKKDRMFSIGGKIFAGFEATDPTRPGFKTTPENFAKLTAIEGIIPAPYAARFHWVAIRDPDAIPLDMMKELIVESYQLVLGKLPAKVRKELQASRSSAPAKKSR